jgi:hypothetical protein
MRHGIYAGKLTETDHGYLFLSTGRPSADDNAFLFHHAGIAYQEKDYIIWGDRIYIITHHESHERSLENLCYIKSDISISSLPQKEEDRVRILFSEMLNNLLS